jgi:hypothetical protein
MGRGTHGRCLWITNSDISLLYKRLHYKDSRRGSQRRTQLYRRYGTQEGMMLRNRPMNRLTTSSSSPGPVGMGRPEWYSVMRLCRKPTGPRSSAGSAGGAGAAAGATPTPAARGWSPRATGAAAAAPALFASAPASPSAGCAGAAGAAGTLGAGLKFKPCRTGVANDKHVRGVP